MRYAGNNLISHTPFEGSIEITQEQYDAALVALIEGKKIIVDGGFAIIDPPAPEPTPEAEPEPIPDPLPIPEPEPTSEDERELTLSEYAAHVRWLKEIGGLEIGGIHLKTDEISQTKILGARVAADANPDFTTPWKGTGGSFTMLDATTIHLISNAVALHISNCFRYEQEIQRRIRTEEITTVQQVDEAYSMNLTELLAYPDKDKPNEHV